jgi:uncharacterized protein (TIGR00251 family)
MNKNNQVENLNVIETDDGVIFHVFVQPRAARNELIGVNGNEIRLRLTSPPVEGSANKLCKEYLAELLGVAKSRITIMRGEKSRHKTIKACRVKKKEVLDILLHLQRSPE